MKSAPLQLNEVAPVFRRGRLAGLVLAYLQAVAYTQSELAFRSTFALVSNF